MRRWTRSLSVAAATISVGCSGGDPRQGDATGPGSDATGASDDPGDGGPTSADDDTAGDGATDGDSTGATGRPGGWSWTFEEGTVGAAVPTTAGGILDAGADALHATADDGLRFTAGLRPDDVAIAFEGTGVRVSIDAVALAGAADLEESESATLAITFRTDVHGRGGPDEAATLVAHGDVDGPGWSLQIVDGHLQLRLDDGSETAAATSERRVDDGRWHRAVVGLDRDAGELVLGIDGTAVDATSAGALASLLGEASVVVGADVDGGHAFVGEVDDVAFERATPPRWTAGPERASSPVFAQDTAPAPGGGTYDTIRIPAVVVTGSGTLLAFAEGRVDYECDYGNIDIVMSRSEDGGVTWSPPVTVADGGNLAKVGNPIPIADTVRGRVVLMTLRHPLMAGCSPTSGCAACDPAQSGIFEVRISEDDGLTFGPPVDVSDQVTGDWNPGLIGPSHGIQLHEGPHAGALVIAAMHRITGGKRGGHLLRSDDGGETWYIAAEETDSDVNVNENSVAQLADGGLLVNTRHQLGGSDQSPAEAAAGYRGQARLDAEFQWLDDPPFSREPTFRGPVVHGTVLGWPGSERHGDHGRLLFSYPAGEHGTPAGTRHDLRLWISHDDGAQWVEGTRIVGDWAAYSDVVAIDDSHVGVLYEAGGDANGFYHRVDFLRLAVQGLDDPTLASWTFETLPLDSPADTVPDAGPFALDLSATGNPTAVEGRHASTAMHFDGNDRLCRPGSQTHGALHFGSRDPWSVEAVFRTSAHDSGGSAASGTLVSKTVTGSEPAWWLRIEDGKVRFLAAACNGGTANCGVYPGQCDGLTGCANHGALSSESVSDGQWHRVVVTRDPIAEEIRMVVDDGPPQTQAWPTGAIVKNDDPICLGAFADGARAFEGDLDLVRIRSRSDG